MPTAVSHGLIAYVVGKIFGSSSSVRKNIDSYKFWIFSIVCAVLPDIDIIPMSLGVPYQHIFGHRGLSHSLFFAFIVALLIITFGFKKVKTNSRQWWLLLGYFFLIGVTHILSDAMTSGGLGVGFFMPFDSTRYFLPYRPIRVSPFSILRFFDSEGQKILVSEFLWIWVPSLTILFILKIYRLLKKS